jgi:hypothetical protein
MVHALNRTKVRGVMFFPFFNGYIFSIVTYVTSIFSTKMGILNGFVCNMFFVNIEMKCFSVCGENTDMGIFSVFVVSCFELLFVES